jgi:beta-N-acetylhexosaminidase
VRVPIDTRPPRRFRRSAARPPIAVTAIAAALTALALTTATVGAARAHQPVAPKPAIVWKPIPFGARRKAEMAAYAKRHYGIDTWRIQGPHVIVLHYTAGPSFSSAYNTFAADVPDPELHELPGDCAHFIVDTDGTIYQLVPLNVMCRHTVGLNYTALGIEDVGTSDAGVLGNPRQLHATLQLTLWLMSRFGVSLANVIGHNESLGSPYHRERDAAWRCQTHGDWVAADMNVVRSDLIDLARRDGLQLGPLPKPRPSRCA